MGGYKRQRLAEDIKRELSIIFSGMKDPRIQKGLLSVVRVEVSGDLSYAKIYVSSIEGLEETKEMIGYLEHAAGYIRKNLSQSLQMRKCPQVKFIPDDSIAFGAKINQIFTDLNSQKNDEEA